MSTREAVREEIRAELARHRPLAMARQSLELIAETSLRFTADGRFEIVDEAGRPRTAVRNGEAAAFTIPDLVEELKAKHPKLFAAPEPAGNAAPAPGPDEAGAAGGADRGPDSPAPRQRDWLLLVPRDEAAPQPAPTGEAGADRPVASPAETRPASGEGGAPAAPGPSPWSDPSPWNDPSPWSDPVPEAPDGAAPPQKPGEAPPVLLNDGDWAASVAATIRDTAPVSASPPEPPFPPAEAASVEPPPLQPVRPSPPPPSDSALIWEPAPERTVPSPRAPRPAGGAEAGEGLPTPPPAPAAREEATPAPFPEPARAAPEPAASAPPPAAGPEPAPAAPPPPRPVAGGMMATPIPSPEAPPPLVRPPSRSGLSDRFKQASAGPRPLLIAGGAALLVVILGGYLLLRPSPSEEARAPGPTAQAPSPSRAGPAPAGPPALAPAQTRPAERPAEPNPPAAPPAPVRTVDAGPVRGVPEVVDTGTLRIGGRIVRLFGVEWAPGGEATALAAYLRGREVACQPVGSGPSHRCLVDGQDLSRVVLFNGGGRATAEASTELLAAEEHARQARTGVWRR